MNCREKSFSIEESLHDRIDYHNRRKGDGNMKVLVIPDVYLKPNMFYEARKVIETGTVDQVVCLMDLADDFGKQEQLQCYKDTYDTAREFAKDFPNTLWCWGNHDLSYIWEAKESGYSEFNAPSIKWIMERFKEEVPNIAYIHRIDQVLFMHGGMDDFYVWETVPELYDNISMDEIIEKINGLGFENLWRYGSPIWCRPQYSQRRLFREENFLYVVGHTSVEKVSRGGNVISTDTFSTHKNGDPIDNRKFLLLDTETWEYEEV